MLAVDRARVPALSPVAMHSGCGGSLRQGRGSFHDSRSGGCGAASPLIGEVGPTVGFEAAFDCEQGVGSGFRSAASRLTERNRMLLWSRRQTGRCPFGSNRVLDGLSRSASAIPKRSGCASSLKNGVHPNVVGQTAGRCGLSLRKSGQRSFSHRHSAAGRASAQAFDQRRLSLLIPENETRPTGMRSWSGWRMGLCPFGSNRILDRFLRRVGAIPKKNLDAHATSKAGCIPMLLVRRRRDAASNRRSQPNDCFRCSI